jgi:formate dehydrogenase formation protein
MTVDLREAWSALLRRRPALGPVLGPYGDIIDGWAGATPDVAPLAWGLERCREVWARDRPLTAEVIPPAEIGDVEPLLERAMRVVASLAGSEVEALGRLAEAWDQGEIGPNDLMPSRGRIGSTALTDRTGLRPASVAFLAQASLRPVLEPFFTGVRTHLAASDWRLGVCPFCGAPPGFADVVEDGRRVLACHFCGGAWPSSRTRCPFCGCESTQDLVRLELGEREEGYVIAACVICSAYVKELDRRTRWNGGAALVEDWGSPHFDLVARRKGYWRPTASLVDLDAVDAIREWHDGPATPRTSRTEEPEPRPAPARRH